MINIDIHPCFNAKVKGQFGRVHLPVAPKCNILCNYCNRKFDCVNESRPGVTSSVLSPAQAIAYLERVLEAQPCITVAGIAGPGDPFANPKETMETLRLIRERFPELLLCLASNGLGLMPYLDELAELQVSHVTITVNAVDPEIGAKIYSWVRDGKVIHRGRQAAEVLLARQLDAIRGLKSKGIVVKVNTIIIPGINDQHVEEVARKMAALQAAAGNFLPQMRHCTRCRADAVGLLDADQTEELRGCLSACAQMPPPLDESRPYVAVGSQEGILVNLHLGEADSFQIWGPDGQGFRMLEERPAPPPGGGGQRWWDLAEVLKDCRAVLVSGVGETPMAILSESGAVPLEMNGFIEICLKAVYEGGAVALFKGRKGGLAVSCAGKGDGCQ